MLSEKIKIQEKTILGYVLAFVIFLMFAPGFGLGFFPSLIGYIIGIYVIIKQRNYNRQVPENNILAKYVLYIEQAHSEIPEKYHEAIIYNLHNLHYSSFGGFDESITFSTDELDQQINEFMKDADQNLKEYAKLSLQ